MAGLPPPEISVGLWVNALAQWLTASAKGALSLSVLAAQSCLTSASRDCRDSCASLRATLTHVQAVGLQL